MEYYFASEIGALACVHFRPLIGGASFKYDFSSGGVLLSKKGQVSKTVLLFGDKLFYVLTLTQRVVLCFERDENNTLF